MLNQNRCIPDQEKLEIRKVLEHIVLTEPLIPIATQLAVILAKVSRLDVPKEWPTLLPLLLENIRSTDGDRQYRFVFRNQYHKLLCFVLQGNWQS